MSNLNARITILVKAVPNPSKKYGETVCCAGVTASGQWKRLFPVRFRYLQDSKFKRWDWVSFHYRLPAGDARSESCHVYEDKMAVDGVLKESERSAFLGPLVLPSTAEAAARGMSLTLIRPIRSEFKCRKKPTKVIEAEREGYRLAARQTSFLDKELQSFEPAPYAFAFAYEDAAGKHLMQCGDWETSATYWRHSKKYGEKAALDYLFQTFNEEYPRKGMVFAMGTVKKRPHQWLLLGVIRLDEERQDSLLF